jgi:DNA repair photolyase
MVSQLSLFDESPAPAIPEQLGAATIGLRPGSKVLTVPKGMASDFDYSLNPYVGCGFACAYCFAANFVADDQRRADWGKWVDIKVDAERQVLRTDLRGKKIFMSSATDPYQPLEQKVGLTRRILEAIVPQQPHLIVQTRSPLVTRDIDLLKRLDKVCVNMSITTDSERVRKRFEPSCASIDRRIEALAEVSRAGIPTMVCIAPMLPIEDPEAFAARLGAIGAKAVVTGYFHHRERQFAASTREPAVQIAKEYCWTREDYERTLAELNRHLPIVKRWTDQELPSEQPRMRREA